MHAPVDRYLALPTGLTYHALEWEHPTSATTIVLVHGFLDLAWGWRWVAEELARSFHVVAPDLRGHGDSDWIGAGGYYHFLDYVADLDAVIARVRRDRLVLVGHSMGASVASYWAGARAEHAEIQPPVGLALLEGLGPPESTDDVGARVGPWIDQWTRARQGPSAKMATVDDAAARLRRHDPLLAMDRAAELARRGTRPVPGGLAWKHDPLHVTFGPLPFRRELAASLWRRIRCPALLVEARQSTLRLAPEETAARLRAFADVRAELVDDAGHMMQRHQPARIARLIADLGGAP
ncbi:MAG: alpha/beta hydrolase [Kofleriaceae bacterium]